jgi:hypothetical protein
MPTASFSQAIKKILFVSARDGYWRENLFEKSLKKFSCDFLLSDPIFLLLSSRKIAKVKKKEKQFKDQ